MSSETKERILASAARLFHENGFHATSVAAILSEAGVNSGSLYHFFPGKEALLAGVLERYLAALGPSILSPLEESVEDPLERIFQLLDRYRRGLLGTGFRRGSPIGDLAPEVGNLSPRIRVLLDAYMDGWTAAVRGWLEEAGDRLPSGLDRASLARLVLAVMEGGALQARAAASPEPFDAAVAELRNHLELLARIAAERPATARQAESDRPVEPPPAPPLEHAVQPGGTRRGEAPASGDPAWRAW
ncbi:MAG: TetR/AcrR family transcriptional regulator [Gemmatimonadota bacterium]